MRISVDEAREYFLHPSQQRGDITPENLPDEGFEYWADACLCIVFHLAHYPGVWMVHIAAKPEGRGFLDAPAKRILREFWKEKQPARLIGWTPESNRAALALARRAGFVTDGRLPLPSGALILSGWSE